MSQWPDNMYRRSTTVDYSLTDPALWASMGIASRAESGVSIDHDSALTYAPLWRGVSLISRDVAKLPLSIFKRRGEGKERATEHPAYRLLRRKPNSEMVSFTFRQTLQAHALLRGNGYAYIVRDGSATPIELLPLPPDRTYPVREGGRLYYVTTVPRGDGELGAFHKLPPENVLHIKGLGYDGLCGYSVIQKAKDSLGLGMGAQKYGSRFFKNNARPSVVIETPGVMSAEAQKEFLRQWENMHSGLDNSHRTAILTMGAKANPFSMSAADSQLLETRKFEVREVANWLGIPPHKLGDDSRTSFASLEQENQSYLDDTLDGWLVAWEEECTDKLMTEEEKRNDTHFCEFIREALVRANLATRSAYYRTALGGRPWMSQNEVRSRENLNPVEGGDEILDPLNMGQGGANNDPKPDGSEPKDDEPKDAETLRAASRDVLIDIARRMAKRIGVAALRAARQPGAFLRWLDDSLEPDNAATMRQAFEPGVAVAVASGWPDVTVEGIVTAMLDESRERILEASGRSSAAELPAGIEALAETMETELPELIVDRLLAQPPEA